jgi:dTDP-4-dehydrorhamnose 3,5-epimerase
MRMEDRKVTSSGLQRDLLETTLAAAERDRQTVTAAGSATGSLPAGVVRTRVPTHIDDRGWLVEMFDPRWDWVAEPLVYAYSFTVRPGHAKGWAIHKGHADRYFLLLGEAETVLYDVRPESATYGQVSVIRASEFERGIMTIPPLIWHATRNLGAKDAVFVNFPTAPYDHDNPEKYRLPLDTPLIPYSFGDTPGW